METPTEEDGLKTVVCRWPASLVARIDELAEADRRNRNNWLLVKVDEMVEREKAMKAEP